MIMLAGSTTVLQLLEDVNQIQKSSQKKDYGLKSGPMDF